MLRYLCPWDTYQMYSYTHTKKHYKPNNVIISNYITDDDRYKYISHCHTYTRLSIFINKKNDDNNKIIRKKLTYYWFRVPAQYFMPLLFWDKTILSQ